MVNKIYPNCEIGDGTEIGEFVVIGEPPKGKKSGELKTCIGKSCKIRSHTVIYAGTKIGDNFQTGHGALIREDNNIGNDCSVGSHTVVENGNLISDDVRIHSNCFIPQFCKFEKGAWVGPGTTMANDPHPPCGECMKGPTLEEGAKVGANCTLLPFVKIGKMALVGAGTVVTKDVSPFSVVVGNPMKRINDTRKLKCDKEIKKSPYGDEK